MNNETKNETRQPKFHSMCPILPVGLVNLTTGKNAKFGVIWDCWNDGSNILVKEGEKFRVVHTSGGAEDFVAGDTIVLAHDQAGARIGGIWTIVGTAPHTPAGLLELKRLSGKSSLAFATFK